VFFKRQNIFRFSVIIDISQCILTRRTGSVRGGQVACSSVKCRIRHYGAVASAKAPYPYFALLKNIIQPMGAAYYEQYKRAKLEL
jgi:hypothetical protein